MALVRLDTHNIFDWPSFHAECRRTFRLPASYSADLNAWVHCMASVRDPYGPVGLRLADRELLYVELPDAEQFERRVPEIANALIESAATVNRQLLSSGRAPVIALMRN